MLKGDRLKPTLDTNQKKLYCDNSIEDAVVKMIM